MGGRVQGKEEGFLLSLRRLTCLGIGVWRRWECWGQVHVMQEQKKQARREAAAWCQVPPHGASGWAGGACGV